MITTILVSGVVGAVVAALTALFMEGYFKRADERELTCTEFYDDPGYGPDDPYPIDIDTPDA